MTQVPLIKQFLQCQSEFRGYLMALTRDFEAAEEIFQDAAVVVMEASTADEPIRNFRAWAKEVVRRQALYYLRQHKGPKLPVTLEPQLMEQITAIFMEDSSEEQHLRRELQALRHCVQQAQPEHREMLILRYEQKASFRQISQQVRRTEAAVQRALSRIRKQLHECIKRQLRHTETAG